MLKKGPALAVLAMLCVITAALIGTTVWRQFQFAEFLEVSWMGLLALCAAQLGMYGFPAVWGYLGFSDPSGVEGDTAVIALGLGILGNFIFAAVTAGVEFGLSFTVVSHIVLPVLASVALACTVFLLASYRPGIGLKAE